MTSGAVTGGAILAVAGLAREARIAAGPGVETIQAGGNPERLRAALDGRSPRDLRAVVSFGIAGGSILPCGRVTSSLAPISTRTSGSPLIPSLPAACQSA